MEDDLKILKVEYLSTGWSDLSSNLYLSNDWTDHPQILNLSLDDKTKIDNCS